MKIGILTVYSFNYGSYFQATALYKKLEEMGYECEFINERFKQYRWGNLFLLYTFDGIMPKFVKSYIAKFLPQYETYLRLKKDVLRFRESPKHLHDMRQITSRYDGVVLGADEMWSANKKSIRYMPEHFGRRICCPHISYATSGCLFDVHDKKLVRKAAKGMKTFSAIAVRDLYTKKVADKLTKDNHPVVLDPTLLYPYFISDSSREKKGTYLLLYGQHYSQSQREYIQNKAREMKLPIMALGWPQEFADEFLDPVTAEEFQNCFSEASFCFPSTFHGTIFSILHHKPFLSMTNQLRGKKVRMLLEQLELADFIFEEGKESYPVVDYEKVEKCLAKQRAFSETYLQEALLNIGCTPNDRNLKHIPGNLKCQEDENPVLPEDKCREKEKRQMICPEIDCTGCFACHGVCPVNAISLREDKQGFLHPRIDTEVCINCNRCRIVCPQNVLEEKICPQNFCAQNGKSQHGKGQHGKEQHGKEQHGKEENDIIRNLCKPMALYGAFSKNVKQVRKSSSGGIFGELAAYVLQKNGVVYGVAFTKNKEGVVHQRITSLNQLPELSGSKYVQSNTAGTYSMLEKDLKEGKMVLYSGTPCQIAGVQSFVKQTCPETWEHLITVDILCHGVPSPMVFRDYIRSHKGKEKDSIASLTFRDKTFGWRKQAIAVHFTGGNHYLKRTEQDIYYRLYFKNIMLRPSCYDCRYIHRNRIGDITLGDYWGAEDTGRFTRNQVCNGISYVSLQTEKGRKLFDAISQKIVRKTADEKSSYQPLFDKASKCPNNYSDFWRDYNAYGYDYATKKYSRYGAGEILVKKVLGPVAKKMGLYKIAQKIYFVFFK
ncbi:MAG: polysaccharide pyruvyl transferase family protein [Lachnospiraceae bacterium]